LFLKESKLSQTRLNTIKAFAALILLSILWGYNWVVMKFAMLDMGPFQFGALRTFGGALCLMALMLLLKKPLRPREIPTLILLGILQTCGFTGLIIWALVSGGAGKTAVLTYTMPFWVMVLAWPLLGEKIRGMQWIAVFASVLGLLLIFDPLHLGSDVFSMWLAVAAGIFWALAVILAKKLHHRVPDLDLMSLTGWQMFFGSLPLVLVAFLVDAPPIHWTPRLFAGIASMTSMLAPLIGVLAAWIQLGEQPSTSEIIGMIFIALALLVISLHAIKAHDEVDPAMGQD
jgi:drug/metabolite transporter (DMT)-like permease